MNFINFLIVQGYKVYRKVYNKALKKWEYIQDIDWEKNFLPYNRDFFSSMTAGCMDIRLINDKGNEIVWGIPGVFIPENAEVGVTHPPTLIYPNPFGSVDAADRAFDRKEEFEGITNEKILQLIEEMF
jgi:hypothetical protein